MQPEQWQGLLAKGNKNYYQQQWQQAEAYYKQAYELLASNHMSEPSCTETLVAWIGTCHNLSALFEAQAHHSAALRFLTLPHEYVQSLVSNKEVQDSVRFNAINSLHITLQPLLMYAKSHPICDDCQQALTELKTQMPALSQAYH